jgi:hypothetical protein
MTFNIEDFTMKRVKFEPRIILYPTGFAETLGDNPETHRWRAMWDQQGPWGRPHETIGIALEAYPVAKRTPCGAWIDKTSMVDMVRWEDAKAEYGWNIAEHKSCWRWVSDTGGAAWAKPTREAALHSLVIRLCRWGTRLGNDVNRFRNATAAAEALLPGDVDLAKAARRNFEDQTARRTV